MGAPPPARDPLGSLLLQLDEGAYVSYTVRMVKTDCPVSLTARSCEGARLRVREGESTVELEIPAGASFNVYPLMTLAPADARTVRLEAVKGSAQLESIMFA